MDRRNFIKNTSLISGGAILGTPPSISSIGLRDAPLSLSEALRWAQLVFVENDPGNYDPDFWLAYFKRIHAQGALLSAGGVVAFYPTKIPLHHRSEWMGDTDPLGYLVKGCRKMNMAVIVRTDPHAARQDVYDAHPDWIAVTADGEKRRHWANPELWVTCGLGPYNFEFMTAVNKEIMEEYQPDAIFSNRWSGHGICYCEHCVKNFKAFSGMELPRNVLQSNSTAIPAGDINDPAYRMYVQWRIARLKELWFLWDDVIKKEKSSARFIPNGFPDKLITGQNSDFFFADQQGRSGLIPPWSNGMHAKQIRATMGMKPQVGIFSVGVEEQYRWKDSVQTEAETRVWVADGIANGLLPCFVKFSAVLYDKRWLEPVAKIYESAYKNEKYLKNTAPLARVGLVYSEQTERKYGDKPWQKNFGDHQKGMYHALIEDRMPFEMVNDQLMTVEELRAYKLLLLPNIAVLSSAQCDQLKKFVEDGGSILATYETSLYDEEGKQKNDFGLSELFGVSYDGKVEGPLQNSYLRLKSDPQTKKFHPILKGLEDAYRIINGTHKVNVNPTQSFPPPVTLIPSYPDLPMEDVYPRQIDTDINEVYLREIGKGRVAYIPWDIDRSFWQILSKDHGTLLTNIIRWALNEETIVDVKGPGVIDVTAWKQEHSMAVHLVNLTNPMMMKGPFRELIPVDAKVSISLPSNKKVTGVHLLMSGKKPVYEIKNSRLYLKAFNVTDHEIIGVDFA
ncbi:MAG: alpha-amylase family protein [Ginsengibacter sp.]